MSNINANDYYVISVDDDTTYGTQQLDLTAGVAMADVSIEMTDDVGMVETGIRTQDLKPDIAEKLEVSSSGTVTLKGMLCKQYSWLIGAATMCASSPYTLTSPQPAGYTYNLYQYFPGTTPKYDVALGCIMQSFKITGESGGLWSFEATFRAFSIRRGITSAGADEVTTVPAITETNPFVVGDTTASLSNTVTSFISYGLTIEKTFAPDKHTYQNSRTKIAEIITGFTGTIEYSTLYDDVLDNSTEQNFNTAQLDSVTLTNGTTSWLIETAAATRTFSKPDATKDSFEAITTAELADDGSHEPVTITVTVV